MQVIKARDLPQLLIRTFKIFYFVRGILLNRKTLFLALFGRLFLCQADDLRSTPGSSRAPAAPCLSRARGPPGGGGGLITRAAGEPVGSGHTAVPGSSLWPTAMCLCLGRARVTVRGRDLQSELRRRVAFTQVAWLAAMLTRWHPFCHCCLSILTGSGCNSGRTYVSGSHYVNPLEACSLKQHWA